MKYMDKCTVSSCVVNSGVRIHWNVKDIYSCAIFLRDRDKAHYTLWETRIVYTSFFCRVYHVIVLGGEWIYGSCQVKKVCTVPILV